jgi:hypothetical protein
LRIWSVVITKFDVNSPPKNENLPFQLKLDNSLLDVGRQNHLEFSLGSIAKTIDTHRIRMQSYVTQSWPFFFF